MASPGHLWRDPTQACSHALQVLLASLPPPSVAALTPVLRARLGEVEHSDMTPEQLQLLVPPAYYTLHPTPYTLHPNPETRNMKP